MCYKKPFPLKPLFGTISKQTKIELIFLNKEKTSQLVVEWSELLTTNHEVPGSIPGSTMGILLVGKYPPCDHGLGS